LNRSLPLAAPLALAIALLAAVWVSGRAANPGPIGFPLDDAWIHQVYARSLSTGGGLAYDDGIPTTGCTSPLWAMLLAGVHAVTPASAGTDGLVRGIAVFGFLLQLGVIVAGASLARRVTGDDTAGFVAGAVIALSPPLAVAAYSGMEVPLTAMLLLLGARAAVSGSAGRAGLWLGLAGAARPESAIVIVVVGALLLARAGGRRDGLRFLVGPVAVGAAFIAYDLWATGSPLPATFYAKGSLSLAELPGRLARAFVILGAVPPLTFGLGALALAGLVPGVGPRKGVGPRALPALAALAFLLANVALIDPVDPQAFYHVRYLLPAAPMLLVALAIGAHGIASRLPARRRSLPAMLLLLVGATGAALTVGAASRHFHNDVRNINEVQRRIGEHLADALPPGARIATTDAGAVRFFSRRPTLDCIGLNTPEMRDPTDAFLRAHPVHAVVLLPAWFRSPDAAVLTETFRAVTEDYTVTSNPAMAGQIVLRARADAGPPGSTVRARFTGFHPFALDFVVPPSDSSP
jgi:hypothetical protein